MSAGATPLRRSHAPRRVVLGSAVALTVLGVVAVRQLVPNVGSSTPIAVAAARAFDGPTSGASATGAAPVTGPLPAPGVYVYTTTGRDARGVDHHDYPAVTTITVQTSACGVTMRWDVLEERWEQWERCARDGGIGEPSRITSDRFFGQAQTDTFACTGDARPLDGPAGGVWKVRCAQGGVVDSYMGTIVGTETKQVGGASVETLHVRVHIAGAEASDVRSIDSWYQLGTDLLVAQRGASATTEASTIGAVHYTEQYEIRLTSLQVVR